MLEFDPDERHTIRFPAWLNRIIDLFDRGDDKDLERRAEITGSASVTRHWGPEWFRLTRTVTIRKRDPRQ